MMTALLPIFECKREVSPKTGGTWEVGHNIMGSWRLVPKTRGKWELNHSDSRNIKLACVCVCVCVCV